MSFYQDYKFTASGTDLTSVAQFGSAAIGTQFTKVTGEIYEKTATGIYKKVGVEGTGGNSGGSDPVSGYFPTGLNVTERYVPSDNAVNTGYTYSGSGRCLILGIYAANISDLADLSISAWFSDSSAVVDYNLAYEMPVPVGSTVNILKNPKVLEPSDLLKLQTDSPGYVEFTIVGVDLDTGTDHFSAAETLSTVNSFSLRTATTFGDVIGSIQISNDDVEPDDDNDAVQVSVWWEDASSNVTRMLYSGDVYPGQTLEVIDAPMFLVSTAIIKAQANKADCADVIIAGYKKTS